MGVSSETEKLFSVSCTKRQNFRRKLCTPFIPFTSQGLNCSSGPKNISYKRKVSAPKSSTKLSGVCTLYFDFDIFSTSCPHKNFPSSFRINSALANSSLQFLNASTSNSSLSTNPISVCNLVVLYSFLLSKLTKVLVSFILSTKLDLPKIIPWFIIFLNGSSKEINPLSYKNLVQKREYNK